MDMKLPPAPTGPTGPTGPGTSPGAIRQAERTAGLRGMDPARGTATRGAARPDGNRARDAGTARPEGLAPIPPGPERILRESMGRVDLPPPLELMAALEAAQVFAPLADRAVPGLGRLVSAVIEDERFKLARMLDLGR